MTQTIRYAAAGEEEKKTFTYLPDLSYMRKESAKIFLYETSTTYRHRGGDASRLK